MSEARGKDSVEKSRKGATRGARDVREEEKVPVGVPTRHEVFDAPFWCRKESEMDGM